MGRAARVVVPFPTGEGVLVAAVNVNFHGSGTGFHAVTTHAIGQPGDGRPPNTGVETGGMGIVKTALNGRLAGRLGDPPVDILGSQAHIGGEGVFRRGGGRRGGVVSEGRDGQTSKNGGGDESFLHCRLLIIKRELRGMHLAQVVPTFFSPKNRGLHKLYNPFPWGPHQGSASPKGCAQLRCGTARRPPPTPVLNFAACLLTPGCAPCSIPNFSKISASG